MQPPNASCHLNGMMEKKVNMFHKTGISQDYADAMESQEIQDQRTFGTNAMMKQESLRLRPIKLKQRKLTRKLKLTLLDILVKWSNTPRCHLNPTKRLLRRTIKKNDPIRKYKKKIASIYDFFYYYHDYFIGSKTIQR